MTDPDDDLSARALVGLLAEDRRLRVVAALALGASTAAEVRAATGLGAREAATALARLERAGLVIGDDETLVLLVEAFRRAARAAVPPPGVDEHADQPAQQARILRAFVRQRRLVKLPTTHAKRLVVLDLIVQDLEPGVRFSEKQVNAVLVRWHPDTASLRRWLVDVGFLDRGEGWYWRSGGSLTKGPLPDEDERDYRPATLPGT